jgi:hypothetical protein
MRSVGPPCPFVLRSRLLPLRSHPLPQALHLAPHHHAWLPTRRRIAASLPHRLFVLGSTFSVFLRALLSFSASPHASPSTRQQACTTTASLGSKLPSIDMLNYPL